MTSSPEMMCEDCTCCRNGNCTSIGRFTGYCSAVCPCEPFDQRWMYDVDADDFVPLDLGDDE